MKNSVVRIIVDVLIVVCVVVGAFFLSNYLFMSIPIDGQSMETTIHDGDSVLMFRRGEYKRGDIVVFNTHQLNASGAERLYVKRIIAIGGDVVEKRMAEDGKYYIYVNGERQTEDYLSDDIPRLRENDLNETVIVPEGFFYYCGDNRLNSSDSRTSGTLGEIDSILGRVIARYKIESKVLITDFEFIKRP